MAVKITYYSAQFAIDKCTLSGVFIKHALWKLPKHNLIFLSTFVKKSTIFRVQMLVLIISLFYSKIHNKTRWMRKFYRTYL